MIDIVSNTTGYQQANTKHSGLLKNGILQYPQQIKFSWISNLQYVLNQIYGDGIFIVLWGLFLNNPVSLCRPSLIKQFRNEKFEVFTSQLSRMVCLTMGCQHFFHINFIQPGVIIFLNNIISKYQTQMLTQIQLNHQVHQQENV